MRRARGDGVQRADRGRAHGTERRALVCLGYAFRIFSGRGCLVSSMLGGTNDFSRIGCQPRAQTAQEWGLCPASLTLHAGMSDSVQRLPGRRGGSIFSHVSMLQVAREGSIYGIYLLVSSVRWNLTDMMDRKNSSHALCFLFLSSRFVFCRVQITSREYA